jgi:hypothetical protein
MKTDEQRNAETKARRAIAEAKKKWGDGWTLLSTEQREGAVALRLCAMLTGQDEETAPPALRRLQMVFELALLLEAES